MCIHLHKACALIYTSLNFLRRVTKKGFSDKYKGDKKFTKIRTNCMQLFSTWWQFIMTLSNTQKHHKWIQKYMTLMLWSFERHEAKKEAMKCVHDLKHKINILNVRLHLYLFTQNISELKIKEYSKHSYFVIIIHPRVVPNSWSNLFCGYKGETAWSSFPHDNNS